MLAGDPRADPAVIDLIELAGLWLAADDRAALERTLQRLVEVIEQRFPDDAAFRERWSTLRAAAADSQASGEDLRRQYRRATLG